MTCAFWRRPTAQAAPGRHRLLRPPGSDARLAASAASIGGLDGIVFTGGIGENSVRICEAVLEDMHWIGVNLDRRREHASAQVIIATKDFECRGLRHQNG